MLEWAGEFFPSLRIYSTGGEAHLEDDQATKKNLRAIVLLDRTNSAKIEKLNDYKPILKRRQKRVRISMKLLHDADEITTALCLRLCFHLPPLLMPSRFRSPSHTFSNDKQI